jgi:fructosamine-3-kinase
MTIPDVLLCEETGDYSFLLLNFLESIEPLKDFWQIFGFQMASLHRKSSTEFGLDHDNYIGSLNQSNRRHRSWIEFMIIERIQPQIKMAMDSKRFGSRDIRQIDSLCKKLPDIIPEELPALLHGDLWSGNFMTGVDGLPVIFDPAVYYGHRETDIGMTKLFGGFSPQFYEAYNDSFPMEKGWENRIAINQLYPLLVHVNLFGGGYVEEVRKITGKF